ncbi:CALM1-like protein [Mya arenaria]|uniref:CALM1-like protein n=1 Tax=Mya arenaria TaxID=6604 RepID=A0ABY7F798_MYAAR|nr:uncharacterized protein LOC128205600 [Mya arenaria]WAR18065.1 CALM1-like protein [Mya arenaria]
MSKAKGNSGTTKNSKTKKQKSEIEQIFEKIDLNNDGRISVIELTKAARLLGMNPTQDEAAQMIADCNPSQEGYVNKSEFRKLFSDQKADIDAQVEEMKTAFKVFDKDNSGTISRDEIREVLNMAGEKIDDSEIDEMLRKVDIDGDGNISIDEFAAVMCDL